jgi:hypothetical protein
LARKLPKNNPRFYTKRPVNTPAKKTQSPNENIPTKENPLVHVEYRNTLLNKIIHYEGLYLNTCGQAVLIKLNKQEGQELSPKLACMIYDKDLNADLNPAGRLQQIAELFQKIAYIRGVQTIDELVQDLAAYDIFLSVPKMGGMFKTKISGRLYDDPGFLFEFFEEAYDLDQFINQFPAFLTQSLKTHLVYQLLATYLLIFDNPHSDIRFVHNDLFPANLLVFHKNWHYHLVVIDWAGGGFYHKRKMQFLSTPLVYGRPAYTNILIPYEMNPNHQFFHATTDYFLLAGLIFYILSGGESPFVFLRNISEKKILELVERLQPIFEPYVVNKEPIPYAFPPGPEEWEKLGIEDLIRTQNRNDAIIIIRNTSKLIKDNFPGLEDLFYRSFVLGYKNPKVRPTPQDYFERIQNRLGRKNLTDLINVNQSNVPFPEPPEVDTVPFSLPAKDLRLYNGPPLSSTNLVSKIRDIMQKSPTQPPPPNNLPSVENGQPIQPKNSPSPSNVEDVMAKMKEVFRKKPTNP